jgi:GT2 family glycosyltransferase
VVAIVVTYRSRSTLPACLAALRAQEGVVPEIHVVDNASDDGTAELARQLLPDGIVEDAGGNLGYGRANNRVLLTVPADDFAIVNPDAIAPPGSIAAAVAALEKDPGVGVVGLRHEYDDGRPQPSAFRFLSLGRLFAEMFALERVVPAWSSGAGIDPARPARVDWLQGSFLVLSAEAVRRTGGFDPAIHMYGEDMEWCWRLKQAGLAALYLPEPVVRHAGGASAKGQAPALYVEHLRNRVRFFAVHKGPLEAALARAILATSLTLRWVAAKLGVAGSGALYDAAMGWVARGLPLERSDSTRR